MRIALLLLCAARTAAAQPEAARQLAVWMEPAPLLGRPSHVTVRAVDRETRAPVKATVTIHGARDTTFVPANQPFTHVFRCPSTRRDTVTVAACERITVSARGYTTAVVSYAGNVHPRRPD